MKRIKKTKPAPWLKMAGGIKPRTKLKSNRMQEYLAARRIWLKGRLCEATGIKTASGGLVCQNRAHRAEDLHHRKGRVGKLLNDQRFWAGLCRTAHSFIDANRAEAKALGLILAGWNSVPKD